MKRMTSPYAGKKGFPPGTLTHVGSVYTNNIKVQRTDFDSAGADSIEMDRWDESLPFQSSRAVAWIDISGIHDVSAIEKNESRQTGHIF